MCVFLAGSYGSAGTRPTDAHKVIVDAVLAYGLVIGYGHVAFLFSNGVIRDHVTVRTFRGSSDRAGAP